MNLTKSEILNINITCTEADSLKPLFPFQWKQDSLKYLGIFLTPHLNTSFRHYYIPLLNNIISDLYHWSSFLAWKNKHHKNECFSLHSFCFPNDTIGYAYRVLLYTSDFAISGRGSILDYPCQHCTAPKDLGVLPFLTSKHIIMLLLYHYYITGNMLVMPSFGFTCSLL